MQRKRRRKHTANDVTQDMRFFEIQDDDSRRILNTMGTGRPGFFMGSLAMHDNSIAATAELSAAFPDAFHKRTGGVVGIRV